jgi:catechol 2,3-dioxygenase-like lactoylglutathione lyase family enzyme
MINGAHVIIYSKDAAADRAFLRDVMGFPHVDVGEGWLIFRLPDSEVAVHPGSSGESHELYLMCDDLAATMADLKARGVACETPESLGWGMRTRLDLPGGGKLAMYEPRHARP